MSDDTTAPAPLSPEAWPAIELLLAAIYACAARLDKDELTDDAGEPLRIIGNELEGILDVDVPAILAEHASAGYDSSTDLFRCTCGHRFSATDQEFAEHRAKAVHTALLGEAAQ